MELSQQKEQFSHAFVRAVVSVAGLRMSSPDVDDDSVDWCLAGRGGTNRYRSAKLDIQLKCTGRLDFSETAFSFALSPKNYNELRYTNYMVPRILIVVQVPEQIDSWLLQSAESLAMRRCAYWASLWNFRESDNTSSVTIRIPTSQLFTVAAVQMLMAKVSRGETL